MKYTVEQLTQIIDRVNAEATGLNNWELSFMESITDQFERSSHLSDRQVDMLDKIYTEKTP